MYYLMMVVNNSKGFGKVPGTEILVDIMGLGRGIIASFSYKCSVSYKQLYNQQAQERGRNIQ
jgi:hypothetical protein